MAFKIAWSQPFRLLLLGPHSRESIWWLLLLSFRNDWIVTFGMSVQRTSLKSAKQWNSLSPIWKLLAQKKAAQSKLFWIDINKQIYLLNTFWLFSFYEIIISQFSCNQMKLDRKKKIEIIFWRQNFHFSRV